VSEWVGRTGETGDDVIAAAGGGGVVMMNGQLRETFVVHSDVQLKSSCHVT